ncbi:MAG: response regulator transcription factor [Verrucomicrobiales bacterium]|nr:response regulator transcription factor [Verrucomicrobiales bacterium]
MTALSQRPVKVMVVEDSSDLRRSYQVIIDATPGLTCVAAVGSAKAAICELREHETDVVLLDLELPGMSGSECLPSLRAQRDAPPEVVVVTLHDEPEWIYPALEAGATGYLVKPVSPAELTAAIFAVHAGDSPMSGPIARMVLSSFQRQRSNERELTALSRREREVLELLAEGQAQKEIGDRLGISVRTVGAHLQRIYRKLHVHSATAAAKKLLGGRP